MTAQYEVCTRWLDRLAGKTTKAQTRAGNVFVRDADIYSFGTHFSMAHAITDKRDKLQLLVVNGDVWGQRTGQQQSILRGAIKGSKLPSVIIPHSALASAGIELDTIKLIDRNADRTIETAHVVYERPEGSVWHNDPHMEYVRRSDEEIRTLLDTRDAANMQAWEDRHRYAMKPAGPHDNAFWVKWLTERSVTEYPVETTEETLGHWVTHEHRATSHTRRLYTSDRTARGSWNTRHITVTPLDDGSTEYRWTTTRHWLGESLFTATVTTRAFNTCKPCKGSGHPSGIAEQRRRDWSIYCHPCSGNGRLYFSKRRKATFLSGFDHEETRPLYFLCEMPKGKFATLAEAYEGLKPETVKLAEGMGRIPIRQGDIFAVPTGINKRTLRKMGARFERRGVLLGTNHVATEVAYLPDGTTLSRGTLTHDPSGRRPDHRRRSLGKAWHVTVKNTVPLSV